MVSEPTRFSTPPGVLLMGCSLSLGSFILLFASDLTIFRGVPLGLFYVVPVSLAVWFFGVPGGLCLAGMSAAARLIAGVGDGDLPAKAGWNAGLMLGVLFLVAILLDAAVRPRSDLRLRRLLGFALLAGTLGGLVFAYSGRHYGPWLRGWFRPVPAGSTTVAGLPSPANVPPFEETPDQPMKRLAGHCLTSLRLIRPLLLGSRDLAKGSCVQLVRTGEISDANPVTKGDLDGGPGTKLATLLYWDRQAVKTAGDDFEWHQTRLRTFLDNERQLNVVAAKAAADFHAIARSVADTAAAAADVPADFQPIDFAEETTWPGYCLCRLNDAIKARDLQATQRWSEELASATFWLRDLHRWLDFLVTNMLEMIRFQQIAREPFQRFDRSEIDYQILGSPNGLPGGMLTLHGLENFIELERQAEQMFSMPTDRLEELRLDRSLSPESIAVPPARRDTFLAFARALSADNRRTLALAARTPYECCFLINMLFRAETASFVEQQCEVLGRFDRTTPSASVDQLMDVLVYRGHSFAGLEWADGFGPQLLADSADLAIDAPDQLLFAACCKAHGFYGRGGTYGATFTLRQAIETGTFDCVRLTDVALTLLRNAGGHGAGHIRWTTGPVGHAVAACWGGNEAGPVFVDDPLAPGTKAEVWPQAYFEGADWPEFLRENPKPYAAELYVRGLDSYIWAEGYVIRGEHAGTLQNASVPYVPRFQSEAGRKKVFAGPYPDY